MRLFIAEKPSVARAIADGLGVIKKTKGLIFCKNDNVVTNCFGHMLELAEPEKYLDLETAKLKWNRQPLPIIPSQWKKVKKRGVGEQLKIIQEQLAKAAEVVNAGDPDREGQNLVDEVISLFKYQGRVLRYWQSAMDPVSVKRALQNICPNEKYQKWGTAAEARARADWLIGMNLTRKITLDQNIGKVLSVGRVQTPVLKLIVDRDLSIEEFKSSKFYDIWGTVKTTTGKFKAKLEIPIEYLDRQHRLSDLNKAQALCSEIKNQNGKISGIIALDKKEPPKLMFTLTSLSAECSKKFKFSAKKTLDIAQKLYEEYKLTSYPRSSCEYLPLSQKNDVPIILKNIANAFPNFQEAVAAADPLRESKIWNDQKVGESAHTGIVPTLQAITADALNKIDPDCQKVYELIVRRYLAAFLPDHFFCEKTVTTLLNNGRMLTVRVREEKNPGWRILDLKDPKEKKKDVEEIEEQKLPSLSQGMPAYIESAETQEKTTKPATRFTEGSLMLAMKNIAQEIEDPEEKKLLKEDDGLGTEATRAAIIETLKERNYVENQKGKLISTMLGRSVLKVIPKRMQSASLTAQTEKELLKIQKGTLGLNDFINHQIQELNIFMEEANQIGEKIEGGTQYQKCPVCGSNLYHNESRYKKGSFYFKCSNKECAKFFTDVNGKVGAEIVKKEHKAGSACPVCQKPEVIRCESKKKPGTFFWFCRACKAVFRDQDGQMGEREIPGVTCPHCKKGKAYRHERKDHTGFFWKCKECGTFFDDQNGKIGAEHTAVNIPEDHKAKCPKCGQIAVLYEKDGKSRWFCKHCKTNFFNNKDNTIGNEMQSFKK